MGRLTTHPGDVLREEFMIKLGLSALARLFGHSLTRGMRGGVGLDAR